MNKGEIGINKCEVIYRKISHVQISLESEIIEELSIKVSDNLIYYLSAIID